jgi:hypothetical protein
VDTSIIVQYEEDIIILKNLSSFTNPPNDAQLSRHAVMPKDSLSLVLLCKTIFAQ